MSALKEKFGNMKLNEEVNIKKAAASESKAGKSKASELKRERMDRIEHLRPEEIEKRSFEIISEELNSRGIILPKEQEMVTKRAIHTSADFDYAHTLTYSKDAVAIAQKLILNGADIVTDTNMALSGINKRTLKTFGGEVHCFMADEEVARIAKERGHGKGLKDRQACDFCCGKCTYSPYTAIRDDRGRDIYTSICNRSAGWFCKCRGSKGTHHGD